METLNPKPKPDIRILNHKLKTQMKKYNLFFIKLTDKMFILCNF